jgi:hypothetical protein
MKHRFFYIASAELVEKVGLWAIIAGLIGEALQIIYAFFLSEISFAWDKSLSAFFTLTIALGVWIEHAGAAEAAARHRRPRRELFGSHGAFIQALRAFPGMEFDIGSGPNDGEVEDFIWDIEPALEEAGWKQLVGDTRAAVLVN